MRFQQIFLLFLVLISTGLYATDADPVSACPVIVVMPDDWDTQTSDIDPNDIDFTLSQPTQPLDAAQILRIINQYLHGIPQGITPINKILTTPSPSQKAIVRKFYDLYPVFTNNPVIPDPTPLFVPVPQEVPDDDF